MLEIGLTGGIGSGKTRVADMFAARGAALIDTDLLAHEITAPGGAAIAPLVEAFGPGCLRPTARWTATPCARWCSPIRGQGPARSHHPSADPPAHRSARRRHPRSGAPYLIYVVPLLVESGTWRARVGRVLVVDCQEETQMARVMARNGFTREQVRPSCANRPRAQRLAVADDVIDNDGPPEALAPRWRARCAYRRLSGAAGHSAKSGHPLTSRHAPLGQIRFVLAP
jgi:dephospho-CoA kinase